MADNRFSNVKKEKACGVREAEWLSENGYSKFDEKPRIESNRTD